AESIIEREFAADLPGVLDEESPGGLSILRIGTVGDRGRIKVTEQKAGETVTNRGPARQRGAVKRLRCLRRAESELRAQTDIRLVGERVYLPFATRLITVISLDPGELSDSGGLDLEIDAAIRRSDLVGQSAVRVVAKTRDPRITSTRCSLDA